MAISLGCRFRGTFSIRGTLARVSLSGGAPREVLEDVVEADWTPDGKDFAVTRTVKRRSRLEFPIGKVLYETTGWISHPRFSPKGDLIAFLDHETFGDDGCVAVVDLSGRKKTLTGQWTSEQGLAWTPKGDEIWFTATKAGGARTLLAVTPSGRQRLVARVAGSLTLQDVSRDGRVLVTHENARMGIQGLPPGEGQERDLSWLDWSLARELSADGKTVLFDESGEGSGGNYGVYLRKTDGSPAIRLGEGTAEALSPDGKWALSINRSGPGPQLVLLPTRAGTPKPLDRGTISEYYRAAWFPDGKRILFIGREQGRNGRCYVQDVEGGRPRPITPEGTGGYLLSPDGRFVAVVDRDQNAFLYPVDGGEPRPVPGVSPEDWPIRFSADGRSVYIRQAGEVPAKIFRLDVSTGRRELWKQITPSDPAGVPGIGNILLAADEKSYVYSYSRILSDLYLVEGLK